MTTTTRSSKSSSLTTASNSSSRRQRFVGSTSYGRQPDILSDEIQSLRFTIYDFQNINNLNDNDEFFDTKPLKAHNHLWKLTICPKFRSSSNSDELWLSCFLFCIDASSTNICKAVGTIEIGGDSSLVKTTKKSFSHVFQNEGSWCGENEMLSYQDVMKKYLDNQGSLVIDVHIQIYIPKPKVWYPKAQQNNNQQFYAKQLLDHPVGSDIVFVIGSSKERFPAHKCILFPRAPGLYEYVTESAEFSHASIDAYDNNEEIFHFEDVTPTAFKVVLEHIYAGSLPELCSASTEESEEENGLGLEIEFARNLLLVSHKFQCQHLKLYIESEIVSKLVTTTTAADWLALSDDIDCPLLKEACLEMYIENPTSVRKSNGWSKVQGLPTLLDEVLDYLANKQYHHPHPSPQQHNNNTNNTQDDCCLLYDRMSVGELREQCELYNLELIGTRDILIQRLITNSYDKAQIQIEQVAAEQAAASKKKKKNYNNNNPSEEETTEEEHQKSVVTSKKEEEEEVADDDDDDDDNGERSSFPPPLPSSTGNNSNPSSTTTLVDGVKSDDKANIDDDDDSMEEEDPSIVIKESEPEDAAVVDDSNNNNSNGTIFFSPIQHSTVVASKQRTKLRELEQSFVAHKSSSSSPPPRTGIIIQSSPLQLLHGSSSNKSVTFVDEIIDNDDVFVDATYDDQQQHEEDDTGMIITTTTKTEDEDLVVPDLPSEKEEAESIITSDPPLADDKMDGNISKQQQVAAGPVAVSFDDDDDILPPPQQEETSASLTTEEEDDDADDCKEEDHFQDVTAANVETTGILLVDYVEEDSVEGQEAVAVVEGTTTDETIAGDESIFINTPRDTVANFPFSDDEEHEQDDTSYPEVNAESSAAADAKVNHDLCRKDILQQQHSCSYPDPEDPSPEKTPETSFVDDPQQYQHNDDNLGAVAAAVAKIDDSSSSDIRHSRPDPIVVVTTKNNDSQSAMKENNDAVVIVDKKKKKNINAAAIQSSQRVFARRDIIKNISANKAKKIFSKHSLWGSSTSSHSTSTTAGETMAAASPARQPSPGQSI